MDDLQPFARRVFDAQPRQPETLCAIAQGTVVAAMA